MNKLKKGMIALVIMGFAGCCQKPDVPASVKTAFEEKFVDAKNIKWEKENDSEWEAEFKFQDMEYSANFTADGTWVETEHEIQISDLPTMIKSSVETDYAGFEIGEIEISEKVNGIFYEIEFEQGEEKIELVFDNKGTLVKKIYNEDKDD